MNFRQTCILIFSLFSGALYASDDNSVQADSTIHLNEIVVGAFQVNTRLFKIPGSIAVLSDKEIQLSDATNFSSVLHSTPGIFMHSGTHATSRIIIRGVGSRTPYNTNRIKSYLNDIPITSSDGISTPEDIDLLSINRIEITKGPASTLYGSGLGGNINLFTPVKNENNLQALAQYGSFNTIKTGISGNLAVENFSAFGNINHIQSDGFRENNHFRRSSALTSGKWHSNSYSLDYTLLIMNMNAGIPSSIGKTLFETSPQSAAANWKAIEGYKKFSKAIGGVGLENKFSGNWSNRISVFSRWVDSYEKRPFNNLSDGTLSFGIREKLNFHSEKWDFVAGFEFVNDKYNWQLDKSEALINKNSENRIQLNIFGLAYFRPTEKWNITVGGAFNKIQYKLTDLFAENGNQSGNRSFPFIFSPRIGINFTPIENIAIYSSIGHGFSMPSPEETLLPEGDINKDIQPEQGIQSELGLRLNLFEGKTQLDAAVYQINLNNLLVTKRLTEDIFTGINAGKTRHRGLELALRQEALNFSNFPGNLDFNINYTLSENKFVDFTDDGNIFNGNILPGIPSQILHFGINWQALKTLLFQSQIQYVGSQYLNDANSEKADEYLTIQLKTAYQFSIGKFVKLEIYGGVNNLTDARYASMISVNALSVGGNEPRYYYPGLPRNFFAGIKFHF